MGILSGYAIRSDRHHEGSKRPPTNRPLQQPPCQPRPLTCWGISAWPYRVTTKYSFIPCKYISYNNNSGASKWQIKRFNKFVFSPVRMVLQPCHQLKKVTEGRRPEHLLNTRKTVPTLHLCPIIYMQLFNGNMQQIALKLYKINRLTWLPWSPWSRVARALIGARIPWYNNSHTIVTSQ